MLFGIHAPFAYLTKVALVLGGFVLGAGMPAETSSRELSVHGVRRCAGRVQTRLNFGLRGPAGTVSQAEWETFLADVVTPRFPEGLTVFMARQWRESGGRPEQEPSRLVEIVHDASPDARERIDEIVTLFKERHQQSSVMVARAWIEACF